MQEMEFNFNLPSPKEERPSKAAIPKKKVGPKATNPSPENEKLDFENSLKTLESIVAQMESGKLSLEESMKYFEKGTKLANFCTSKLAETEKRVEILMGKDSKEWQQFQDNRADSEAD